MPFVLNQVLGVCLVYGAAHGNTLADHAAGGHALIDGALLPTGDTVFVDVENPMFDARNPLLWLQYGSMRRRLLHRYGDLPRASVPRSQHRAPPRPRPLPFHLIDALSDWGEGAGTVGSPRGVAASSSGLTPTLTLSLPSSSDGRESPQRPRAAQAAPSWMHDRHGLRGGQGAAAPPPRLSPGSQPTTVPGVTRAEGYGYPVTIRVDAAVQPDRASQVASDGATARASDAVLPASSDACCTLHSRDGTVCDKLSDEGLQGLQRDPDPALAAILQLEDPLTSASESCMPVVRPAAAHDNLLASNLRRARSCSAVADVQGLLGNGCETRLHADDVSSSVHDDGGNNACACAPMRNAPYDDRSALLREAQPSSPQLAGHRRRRRYSVGDEHKLVSLADLLGGPKMHAEEPCSADGLSMLQPTAAPPVVDAAAM